MSKKRFFFYFLLICGVASFGQFKFQEPVRVTIRVNPDSLASSFLKVEILLDIAKDTNVYASEDRFFKIQETGSTGLSASRIDLPPTKEYKESDGTIVPAYDGRQTISLQKKFEGEPGSAWRFSGFFEYQACDKTTCYAPQKVDFDFSGTVPQAGKTGPVSPPTVSKNGTKGPEVESDERWKTLAQKFELVSRGVGYMEAGDFLKFLDQDPSAPAARESEEFAGKNIWLVIALILLGGIALNLTPCVLPLIPINLAIIGAGVQSGSRKKGFLLGGVYGLGMALSYGVLGLLVILTGSKFGAINASVWFNLGISVIFVVLGLAMFDLFTIDLSRFGRKKGVDESRRGKIATSFAMGAIAALLAGACVAPVVISVLLYSNTLYAEGNRAALFMPFLLGIGMALPWPFAGASLSFLPKPGAWMVKIKYLFGVFILGMAFYYGYVGYEIWASGQTEGSTQEKQEQEGWMTSLSLGLEKADQEKKPVFIDFWATWCKNCLAMDKTTLKNPRVQSRLSGFVKIKYQAEKPNDSPAKQVLDHFGSIGLPTYVILKPKR